MWKPEFVFVFLILAAPPDRVWRSDFQFISKTQANGLNERLKGEKYRWIPPENMTNWQKNGLLLLLQSKHRILSNRVATSDELDKQQPE
ncbi:MAG: hypothetical protein K1566_18595 [Candidatus Thiodiazotropha sp. (ex. Lucinisca nassula)]|nr:hypothetical protein [Candidatus Thiodiazotropha sp. (ex. Lucinisca nassula)]MBW9262851.1 hypothetical protein [Candidatus Thiodiazotropha sp. (ex. Lucinisca nassula)]MBW9271652.1 hypothetical protein [Candidatus Thiodiazotropha sp. (ex. Lucinisca nassula)]